MTDEKERRGMNEGDYRAHLRLLLREELGRKRRELGDVVPAAIDCSARELVALDDEVETHVPEATAQPGKTPLPKVFVLSSFGGSRQFAPDEIDTVISRRILVALPPPEGEGKPPSGKLVARFRLEPLDARVGPRE
jgi:hypothetical protein